MKWIDTLARLIDGALDAINRKKKRDAANDVANTISNSGGADGVQQSEKSFSDLADKPQRDSTK